jgi:tetratricopeptide (TPR) repeat protein
MEFALDLLAHAETLRSYDCDELLLLKAQVRVLSVFGEQIEKSVKEAESFSSRLLLRPIEAFSEGSLAHFVIPRWSVDLENDPFANLAHKTDQLASAVFEIETALRHKPAFEPVYRPMMARCQFAIGNFVGAAESYRMLLNQEGNGILRSIKFQIYLAIAKCYELSGNNPSAIAMLERCSSEFPQRKGVYLRLAFLLTKQVNYSAIPELLRKEMSVDPNIGEEWRVSTILALSEQLKARLSPEEVENAFFKANRKELDGLRSVIIAFWPNFEHLGQDSQRKWIYGIYGAYFYGPDSSFHIENQDTAVASFGKAVEIELMNRIFLQFRRHHIETGRSAGLRDSEPGDDKYLVKFVKQNAKIMFGEMYRVLESASRDSAKGICRDLRRWVQDKRLSLFLSSKFLDDVRILTELAGCAKHKSVSYKDLGRARELSQRILKAITG